MGQSQTSAVWKTYEPNSNLVPGTYRIIHDKTDQVLQIRDGDHKAIVLQPRQSQGSDNNVMENEHWFLLRSGDGFIFKHCRHGTYITSLLLTAISPQSVCATRYPTTWAIHTKKGANSKRVMCAITVAIDRDQSAPMEYIGLAITPTGLSIAQLSEKEEPDRVWRLERVGDATIEEDYTRRVSELERELQAANDRWTEGESKLQEMREQLDAREGRLENIRSELSKQAMELESVRSGLNQQAGELKGQFKALDTIRDLLDAKERSLYERDKEAKSDRSPTIREEEQVVSQEERETPQGERENPHEEESRESPEATGEVVPDEQVHEPLTQGSQHAEVDSLSRPNNIVPQPVSELAPSPETVTRTTRSSPPPVALDKQLAEMGWSFD